MKNIGLGDIFVYFVLYIYTHPHIRFYISKLIQNQFLFTVIFNVILIISAKLLFVDCMFYLFVLNVSFIEQINKTCIQLKQ